MNQTNEKFGGAASYCSVERPRVLFFVLKTKKSKDKIIFFCVSEDTTDLREKENNGDTLKYNLNLKQHNA